MLPFPFAVLAAACTRDAPGPAPVEPPGPTAVPDPGVPPDDPDPTDPGTGPEPAFPRVVVAPERPLDLGNPQQETVSWPVWGGAFALGEPVALRVAMAPTGTAGIAVAGPGAVGSRVAVEIVSDGGGWTLRETVGGDVSQEVPLDAAQPFVLAIDDTTVTVGGATLELADPLGPDGESAGIYATLDPDATLAVGDLALSRPLPTHPELGTPLRELAAVHGLDVGSATDIWPPLHDLGFESLFAEQFGAASPTGFYWATTRGEDDDYFFVPADLMVNYATVHDQTVTGMFLLWDFALPAWLRNLADQQGPAAVEQALEDHVTTVVSRYRGRVAAWVAVNEAIWGPEDGVGRAQLAQTLWFDALGPTYIERTFEIARAADPDAILLYNETGAEELGEKSDYLYEMVADFVSRGVPIDGVGLQFHVHAADPPERESVRDNLARFAALGLGVYVTELDVSLEGMKGTEAELQQLQAEVYTSVLEACLEAGCRSWTVFGFSDRYAWDELGDARPLLFTGDYQPKPAYYAVQAALQ